MRGMVYLLGTALCLSRITLLLFKVISTFLRLSGTAENPKRRRNRSRKNEPSAARASGGPSSIVGDDDGETFFLVGYGPDLVSFF